MFSIPLSAQYPSSNGFYVDEFDVLFEHGGMRQGETTAIDGAFPDHRASPTTGEPKVSVDELRHPLHGKARRVIATAWHYALQGEHLRAIATLREGMAKMAAVIPYAHALLGVEYLHLGRNAEAVPEFTEAARMFPHDAEVHSNFAVSLCIVGQFEHAEQEARLALYLDPALTSAQELVQMLEENKATQSAR
jgi:tetratricopeptide (TPR) repeat protein